MTETWLSLPEVRQIAAYCVAGPGPSVRTQDSGVVTIDESEALDLIEEGPHGNGAGALLDAMWVESDAATELSDLAKRAAVGGWFSRELQGQMLRVFDEKGLSEYSDHMASVLRSSAHVFALGKEERCELHVRTWGVVKSGGIPCGLRKTGGFRHQLLVWYPEQT